MWKVYASNSGNGPIESNWTRWSSRGHLSGGRIILNPNESVERASERANKILSPTQKQKKDERETVALILI